MRWVHQPLLRELMTLFWRCLFVGVCASPNPKTKKQNSGRMVTTCTVTAVLMCLIAYVPRLLVRGRTLYVRVRELREDELSTP